MMDNQAQRLEALFDAAIDLETQERTALVDRARAEDPALGRELEQLLAAAGNEDSLFGTVGVIDAVHEVFEPEPMTPVDGLGFGTRVGQYELMCRLGRGGMGTVYIARHHRSHGMLVAIKFLTQLRSAARARFQVEAQTMARLSHPNIVKIHRLGEHEGFPYIVLEYIEGQTLKHWLESRATDKHSSPRESAVRALEIIVPVVRALAYAHKNGVIHRDIKPENIMISNTGDIKVLDFGIARLGQNAQLSGMAARHPEGCKSLTRTGSMMGTMPYMSPEQWGADAVDERSDIWAVGIVLYEMIVGEHPLGPLTPNKLATVGDLERPMPSVLTARPDLGSLGSLIDQCLVKDKKSRYSSAAALLRDLRWHLPRGHDERRRDKQSGLMGRLLRTRAGWLLIIAFVFSTLHATHWWLSLQEQRQREELVAQCRAERASLNAELHKAGFHLERQQQDRERRYEELGQELARARLEMLEATNAEERDLLEAKVYRIRRVWKTLGRAIADFPAERERLREQYPGDLEALQKWQRQFDKRCR